MPQRAKFLKGLRLPIIASPMFIVSGVELVVAQCKAGIVGSFPALNARPQEELDAWLTRIESELDTHRMQWPQAVVAPYAVNLILSSTNDRLEADLDICAKHRVPIVLTSLSAPTEVVERVHAYGGIVLHDVTQVRHARKAVDAGVDGLVLVCAGAGGHGGRLSPFAFVSEVREFYDGIVVLAGAMTRGAEVRAAEILGCDAAYLGTIFIGTEESAAPTAYKQMVVDAKASDIVYTPFFSGVAANYLAPSIRAAGLDPYNLPADASGQWKMGQKHLRPKAWKEIWGAGQGVGGVKALATVPRVVDRLEAEYHAALSAPFAASRPMPSPDLSLSWSTS